MLASGCVQTCLGPSDSLSGFLWAGIKAFHEGSRAQLVKMVMDRLVIATKNVDSPCPRWGDIVNDTEFSESSCKVQLVDNTALVGLPGLVRTLHQEVISATAVVGTVELPERMKNRLCSEACKGAMSSIEFGKKTVNVIAAVRLVLEFNKVTPTPDGISFDPA